MKKNRLIQWCDTATDLIRFGPDRAKVSKELLGHLEDRRDALMERGMDEKTATDKALEAMGNAEELAPQLAAVHRPFWGYFLWASKIAIIALLCLCLATIGKYTKNLRLQDTPDYVDFDLYSAESYGGDTGRTLLHLSHPNLSFSSDGNRFVITDAAVVIRPRPDGILFEPQLYIRMRQTSILPWQKHREYFQYFSVSAYFYAQDSLGNEYPAFFTPNGRTTPPLFTTGVQSGIFTYTHELWINNFPPEAEWVDICYEREGRLLCMRVYLDGGEAA